MSGKISHPGLTFMNSIIHLSAKTEMRDYYNTICCTEKKSLTAHLSDYTKLIRAGSEYYHHRMIASCLLRIAKRTCPNRDMFLLQSRTK